MIITKTTPYTKSEIEKLKEEFKTYIKTVIDTRRKICSAGCNRHYESEKTLLDQESNQADIWGGGIDIDIKEIDCNSFINIRPADNNSTNEILDSQIRKKYIELTKYFFQIIYD